MRFHLGQRDDQIGFGHGLWKEESLQLALFSAVGRPGDLLIIQIGEWQPSRIERFADTRFHEGQIGVAQMARAFADIHDRSPAAKDLGRGENNGRMRCHMR